MCRNVVDINIYCTIQRASGKFTFQVTTKSVASDDFIALASIHILTDLLAFQDVALFSNKLFSMLSYVVQSLRARYIFTRVLKHPIIIHSKINYVFPSLIII